MIRKTITTTAITIPTAGGGSVLERSTVGGGSVHGRSIVGGGVNRGAFSRR